MEENEQQHKDFLDQLLNNFGVPERVDIDPEEMARRIKAFGMYLGAVKIRLTKLKQERVLTNFAHPYTLEPYGKPV